MDPSVSVLIAAYNAARFLPTAFTGLEAQSHQKWELIVVEDGSNDGTANLVRDFGLKVSQPVRYINMGANRGVAAVRNRLMDLAEGQVLAFLDADDLWQPQHLASLVGGLTKGAALAFSGIELWDGNNHCSMGHYHPPGELLRNPRRGLFLRSFIQTSSCVGLTKATVARTGSFDERLRIGEDRDYWFRTLADGGTLHFTGLDTCRYTKHEGSSMTRTRRVAEDTVVFFEKHSAASDIPRGMRRRSLADSRWILARLIRREHPDFARKLGWSAWSCAPLRLPLLGWCLFASLPRRRR
jgi:glycosyltransferase involved in cell wall biosynthesis